LKYATLLLALALPATAVAACSATGGTPSSGSAGSATGSGATGSTSSTTGSGATTSSGSTAGSGGAGTGGAPSSAGSGGGTTTSTTSGGTGGVLDDGGGPVDFDGGWQIPDSGVNPPLVGDGGTGVIIGPGADNGSPGKFGGPDDAAKKPVIVYPPEGVVVPPNLNSIEFHFIPAAGQTLFEFTFHAPTTSLSIYTGCSPLNGGCVFKPDAGFWANLVAFARGTQPVTYSLRGVNGQSPGAVGTSAQRTMAFAEQDLLGGIYYWNTNGVVQRYDFGFPNAPAKNYVTAQDVGAFVCVGCHAISRDGKEIAVGSDIPAPAPYKVLDVLSKAQKVAPNGPVAGNANFFSFSPDGNHLLTSNGATVSWINLVTGAVVNPAVVNPGTMPDWSPDGLHMVYAKPSAPVFFPVPGVASASLVRLHFNGVGWDDPTTLVPFNGQNNYYPAFSPTGEWVVFNRSPGNADSFSNASPDPDAGTVPDGELWAVSAAGGAPIRLNEASNPGALSWPKWAPVLQDYHAGKIMWLTFSSARSYGLRLSQGERTQLWMVGFDPGKAAAGQDPSVAAFWLPFQDINGGNHIAQWATTVPRKPCAQNVDCDPGELCKGGHCAPQ
jgi:hypothetical protein